MLILICEPAGTVTPRATGCDGVSAGCGAGFDLGLDATGFGAGAGGASSFCCGSGWYSFWGVMPDCGGSTGFAASRLSLAVSFVACSDFCAQPASASAIASTPAILLGRNIPWSLLRKIAALGAHMARSRDGYRPVHGPGTALITRRAGLATGPARRVRPSLVRRRLHLALHLA